MSLHGDSLVLVLFCLCVCFLCCFLFFWLWFFVLPLCFWLLCFSRSPWNHIISVHYEPEAYYSIGFYCRIHTASKYLHNDLARAIRRWTKKKSSARDRPGIPPLPPETKIKGAKFLQSEDIFVKQLVAVFRVCVCVQMLRRMIILLCGIIVCRGCGGTCPYLRNCADKVARKPLLIQ